MPLPKVDLTGYRFSGAILKTIALAKDPNQSTERINFSQEIVRERDAAIKRWYSPGQGGDWFVQWVKRYYRRWSGEPLHWKEPWQEEYYRALGNPWLERVVVEKSAQVGFSESLIALNAFVLACIRVQSALGFEAERKLRDMVPRIQATFDHIEPIQKSRRERRAATGRKDVDYRERKITVAAVECTFWYASTSTKHKQKRQASSTLSSFTAWVQMADEIELYPEGVLDIATERQSACEMPTKPFRMGSTPGHEGGIIDAQVKSSGNLFEWHVHCPHCGHGQFLHPFGNFLLSSEQQAEDGSVEQVYIDPTGRPLKWFCEDNSTHERSIETSYVGCRQCSKPLPWDAIAAGEFRCVLTGESLTSLCDRTQSNGTPVFSTVAIRLPRLASTLFKPSERIRKLLNTRNPADQIQQGLGIAVSIGGGKISLQRLIKCVELPMPAWCQGRSPDAIVLGVDQGRAHNLGMVQHWWFPLDEKDRELRWLNAQVSVVWWGDIYGFEGIEAIARQYGAHLIGVDNEPEVQLAGAFARKYPAKHIEHVIKERTKDPNSPPSVFLFDQVELKGEDFRRTERLIQGQKVPMFALHRTAGLDWVRNRIYRGQQRFPGGTSYAPGDETNLFAHYLSSDRRHDGTWEQTPGLPDHFFHCDNFCQAAVLCSLYEPKPNPLVFGSY